MKLINPYIDPELNIVHYPRGIYHDISMGRAIYCLGCCSELCDVGFKLTHHYRCLCLGWRGGYR